MTARREFTVDEANELLPSLRASLLEIRRARRVVLKGGEPLRRRSATNGGGRVGKEYLRALTTLRREVEAVTRKGIVLRDPETGLVDFPARREGREVFLCWKLGEEELGFYHGPAGYAGRKPL